MRQKWLFFSVFFLVLLLAACGDSATSVPSASTIPGKSEATSTPVVLGAQPNTVAPKATASVRITAAPLPTSTTAVADPEQTADDTYNQGDFVKAEALYQDLLNKDPNNAELLLKLAAAQLRQAKIDLAIANLEKSLKIDPSNLNTLVLLSQIYLDQNDATKAIPLLEKAVQLQTDSAELSYYLGEAYFKEKQYDKAAAALEKAIKLQPDAQIAHSRLALTYFELGKFPEAEAEFKNSPTT
jgi:predicted Zn-dependent protease